MATYRLGENGKLIAKDSENKKKKGTTYTLGENGKLIPKAEEEVTESSSWFQSGAMGDGFSLKNLAKTARDTLADAGTDMLTGAVGMGEQALDALLTVAPYFAQGQYYQNGGAYQAPVQQKAQEEVFSAAKAGNAEIVAKDLYNEKAVTHQLLTGAGVSNNYLENEMERNSILGAKADSLVQSGGQLMATAGLQAAGVPWFLTTGATSFGAEAENALSQGATLDEAAVSGLVSAGAEILTEQISGGIKFGGKTLDETMTKHLSKAISNKVVSSIVKLGVDIAGEGTEEVLSGILGAVGQKLTYADDKELSELFSKEDALDSFIGGVILGGISGTGKVIKEVKDIGPVAITTENVSAQQMAEEVPVSQQAIKKGYEQSEDKSLYQFALDALAGKLHKKAFHKLSQKISGRMAKDIKSLVGFDVDGYSNEISPHHIKHINARHGTNGVADHSMENLHDVARMGYVIDHYDKMTKGELNYEYKNSDGGPSQTVVLQKKLDDNYYYVVEAVPDAKMKTLHVVSAYINKNDTFPEVGVQNALNPNARNEPQSNVSISNNSIPQISENATPEKNIQEVEEVARVQQPASEMEDIGPVREDVVSSGDEIKTVKEKLSAKLQNTQTELANVQKHRETSKANYKARITDLQAKYDAKKNKNTKEANALLRRIERLRTQSSNIDADYAKRISDLDARTNNLNEQLQEDHTKADKLERKYHEIDTKLEQDKALLVEEFQGRKAELEDILNNKGGYISRRAQELYSELSNLKKGVRASQELGYLLDHGYPWNEMKSTLLNVKNHPETVFNPDSAPESVIREMLADELENLSYEVDDLESEHARRAGELEATAEKEKAEARKAEELITRSELHWNIMEDLRGEFSKKGFDLDAVLKNAKNLATFQTVDNTPQRVMEKALGYKEGQILSDLTVNRAAQNESDGIKWLNSFTDRKNGFLAKISKQYNIKPGSNESAAAQMYAEGFYVNPRNEIVEYGDAELAADFPDVNVQENIKGLAADPRIRQIYDETLEKINESRTRNAYPEIPKLDNYFLHFRAMEDTFSRLGLPFNPNSIQAMDLPTDLNGVTAELKPGQPYFASAMHRTGKRTSFDLLGGLERYLTSAKNQIYHIDDIQTLRALRNHIADTYGQTEGLESIDTLSEEEAQEKIKEVYGAHLSTFAKFLNEEANVLAGKTALIDRGFEGIFGRRALTFLNDLNKQVGSNMVGFNISSSLTNFLAPVQAFAKTNKADFLKAFAQTVSNKIGSVFGRNDGFADQSPVMIRRKGADRFHRKFWQKVSDSGYALMGAVDDISTELIARAKYNELTRKGMESQEAHFETDKWVSRLMGDRSLGQQPQLYNAKTLGLITKFQLEVRNQLDSQFYDTIQEAKVSNENIQNGLERNAKTAAKVTSTLVQLAIGQHLFGKLFESIAGYNPAFDMISVLLTAFGYDDDEESEDTVLDNIEQGFLALLEDLPYAGTFTGGRIPISSALPIEELVTGKDDYGNDKARWETALEAIPYYLLPTVYGQGKKTFQGLSMFDDDLPIAGSYTKNTVADKIVGNAPGNLRFPVEDTVGNRIKAGIFGQYASKNARDYFDNGRSPLKEKQIQEYIDLDLPIRDYWEYRENMPDGTLDEKFDYIASLPVSVEQKNIMINNIVDREEPVDMTNYDDFDNYEEFDWYVKNTEKYNFLQDNGVSYSEYKANEDTKKMYDAAYQWEKDDPERSLFLSETYGISAVDYKSLDEDSQEAYTWAYKNPEKRTVSEAVTEDVVQYRKWTSELNGIRADKDAKGNSINGSAKKKKVAYINNLKLDYGQKIILFRSIYKDDDTYNAEIVEYLNGRDDISYEEMVTIMEELGFTVLPDGTVRW